MKKLAVLFLLMSSCYMTSLAQAVLWDSVGDRKLTFLKGEKTIGVEYIFDGVMINGKTETEFLENRQEEFNDKKKGRGDNFVEHWQEMKTKRYPSHFEASFKKLAKKNIKLDKEATGNYKMVIKLVSAKTGEGSYVKNKPAVADFEISFVDISNNTVMASARILNAKGLVKAKASVGTMGKVARVTARVMNTDVANRIAQCFDAAGMAMGKYVVRFNKPVKKKKR